MKRYSEPNVVALGEKLVIWSTMIYVEIDEGTPMREIVQSPNPKT